MFNQSLNSLGLGYSYYKQTTSTDRHVDIGILVKILFRDNSLTGGCQTLFDHVVDEVSREAHV